MSYTKKLNFFLLLFPILIFSLSYAVLVSTAPERAREQLLFFGIGYVLFVAVTFIDYNFYKFFWKHIYALTLFTLVLTLFFGETRLGATRWLNLGFISLQTSEVAKIGLVFMLAGFISEHQDVFKNIKIFLRLVLLLIPLFALVLIQPDLGSTIVLFTVAAGILFYAGLSKFYILGGLALFGVFSTPLWNLLHEYQKFRILVFINPSLDFLGRGYNIIQALIAVGSGGLLGKGFGRGTQTHLNFLPVYWTDFIVAAFAEEWGLFGLIMLFVIYFLFLAVILFCVYSTQNSFAELLGIGVFFVFFIQFIINVGMNLGLLPVTGVTLPIFSHGGSSLLGSFLLLGVVGNVWMNRRVKT